MKPQSLVHIGKMFESTRLSKTAVMSAAALGVLGLAGLNAQAQAAYRSQFTQVWATVPVGMTNATVLGGPTNTVVFVNGAANARLSPAFLVIVPLGPIVPLAPADAVIVYVISLNETDTLCPA